MSNWLVMGIIILAVGAVASILVFGLVVKESAERAVRGGGKS
jgi:hypothetical protein